MRFVSSDCALLRQTIHGDDEFGLALIGLVSSIGWAKRESAAAAFSPLKIIAGSG